jgi:hypothetical protein
MDNYKVISVIAKAYGGKDPIMCECGGYIVLNNFKFECSLCGSLIPGWRARVEYIKLGYIYG